ncbi:MAG TPA: TIGR03067 domain-containing protein [Mucilaginibacter sp.]
MRLLTIIWVLIIAFGHTGKKNIAAQPVGLNGTWLPYKQEMGGKQWPAAIVEKQKLIIADSAYTVIAESVDKGVVKYAGDNKMDIYGRDGVNKGRHFTAIYKLENGELWICYNLKGDSYPEAFETTGKPLYFLSVFKKEPAK